MTQDLNIQQLAAAQAVAEAATLLTQAVREAAALGLTVDVRIIQGDPSTPPKDGWRSRC